MDRPFDASAPLDLLAALPSVLADQLADALYRSSAPTAVRRAVEELAAAHPAHAVTLRRAAEDLLAAGDPSASTRIGPFRLVSLLGRGGYGEVYLAEQDAPVARRVALKVLKRGMDSHAILQRFAREQDAVARMNHDAIARIHDAGMTIGGQPWFAMELVEGRPLVDHCRERALPLRARLRLFAEICRGVHHAHQKGIVHRDLKSSNVLVARVGDRDAPKLIDFGVARALHDASGAGLTQTGAVVGTPAHMAPEQLASAHGDVDTRTDVYALGVLLYQLVTGVQPFATALAGARTPLEAQRLVLAAEVGRPSQERAAADCPEAAWRRQLAGDVDWIVGKATAREMARRYGSAAELADELERHLADEPVLAGPPSASYRLRKFVQRHRGRVVAAGLVLATALVGAGWTVRYALVADERARAESAAKADAEAQAARAAAASDRFAAKVRDFEQLAGVVRLQKARAAESALYPAAPAQKGALARWLADEAEPLLAMRPDLQETLATIRAMALPWTPEEQERDRAGHPQAEALAKSERRLAAVERETRLAAGEVLTIPALSPTDAARPYNELIAMARMRTGPSRFGRSIHGEEALGLAYAKAARDKNPQSLNAGWALAFALAENARDTDAVALADEILARDSGVPEDGYPVAREVRDLVAAMTSERPSRLAAARADRDALAAAVGARRTWSFAPEQAAASFLHDTLTQLVADLDAFDKLEVANARARLRWATTAYGQSRVLAHPQARMSWADVDAYLRTDARYRAAPARWSDAARLDLVPLGPNPATGLLEFYHLASAWDGVADPASLPLPEPAADGRIRVDLATGIVFVLVPGGRVTLGSQGDDPQAPFYDPERDAEETLHEVDLAPFLLARHEITQAQWHRLTSWAPTMRRPATYHEGGSVAGVNIRSTHPVERVSFVLCEQALARAGLQLPTEAQWEHACRAGTTAVRPVADHELGAFANLADTATKRVAPSFQTSPWDDGHAVHAQVGTYLPNAWGLFDMLGNVAEWCRDPDGPYGSERAGDGLRTVASPFLRRRVRGGSWLSMVSYCRSAARATAGADSLDHAIGLRASRSLQP